MKWTPPHHWWYGAAYTPRKWQREALPRIVGSTVPSLVTAIMGAGKSFLIAEVCHVAELADDEVIVVSTTTRRLVEQLAGDIGARCRSVGRFYSDAKEADRQIVVACAPSVPKLALELQRQGKRCALWIADEAHRTECATMHAAHERLQPGLSLGFSATPFRSSRHEELSLFKEEIVRYDTRAALADGVIVPWRPVPWSGSGEAKVDDVCLKMIRHGLKYGPGIVSAQDVEDAEGFAAMLTDAEIPARAIHYQVPAATQDEYLAQLQRGELAVVVHVSMLQEGVNLPWLRWLCLRRPGMTPVRFAQEVGRVLRAYPGKSNAIVYDPHDHFATFSLSMSAVLEGMAERDDRVESMLMSREGGVWVSSLKDPMAWGFTPGAQVLVELDAERTLCTRIRWVEGQRVTLDREPFELSDGDVVEVRIAPGVRAPRKAAKQVALIPASKLLDVDAQTLTSVEAYLRQVTIAFDQLGVVRRGVFSRQWREKPASDRQQALLRYQIYACGALLHALPEPHRTALDYARKLSRRVSQGAAGDLITVLKALRLTGGWPDEAEIELLEEVA